MGGMAPYPCVSSPRNLPYESHSVLHKQPSQKNLSGLTTYVDFVARHTLLLSGSERKTCNKSTRQSEIEDADIQALLFLVLAVCLILIRLLCWALDMSLSLVSILILL